MHIVPLDGADISRSDHARRSLQQKGAYVEESLVSAPQMGIFALMMIDPGYPGKAISLALQKWEVGRGWFGPKIRWRMAVSVTNANNNTQNNLGFLAERSQSQMWALFLSSYSTIIREEGTFLSDDGSKTVMSFL
jgi:hypothetical protein